MSQQVDTDAYLSMVESAKGWLSLDEAQLLHDLAADVHSGVIVEIGAYRGRSTIALSAGARASTPVYVVEPHERIMKDDAELFGPEDRGAFFENMVRSGAYRNVRLLNVSSEVIAPGWQLPVGLLWIDGDHSYEGVCRDWACWSSHLLPGAVVVFDDAHDESIGPYKLIQDLLSQGVITHRKNVGKVQSVFYTPAG